MTGEISPPNPLFERWGVWKLEDGLRLWVRAELVYVVTEKGTPNSQQMRVNNVVVTEADARFKGDPTAGPTDFGNAKPAKSYEPVEVVSPAESFYQLPDGGVVSLKLRPLRARRYAVFGGDRDPVIQVENVVEIGTISGEGTPTPKRIELSAAGPNSTPAST